MSAPYIDENGCIVCCDNPRLVEDGYAVWDVGRGEDGSLDWGEPEFYGESGLYCGNCQAVIDPYELEEVPAAGG